MADVLIHVAAAAEYEAALKWYLARSVRAATGFVAAFEHAREAVANMPEVYPLCDDVHRRHQLRRYPYGLVYRVDAGRVLVVAVAHDRQLPGFWKGRTQPDRVVVSGRAIVNWRVAMKTSECYISLTDCIAYNNCYAPNYPDEDVTSLEKELDRIKKYFAKLNAAIRSEYKRQQLEYAEREVDLAFVEYAAGRDGSKWLNEAVAWIGRSKQSGPPKNDFVIGADGTAREA